MLAESALACDFQFVGGGGKVVVFGVFGFLRTMMAAAMIITAAVMPMTMMTPPFDGAGVLVAEVDR